MAEALKVKEAQAAPRLAQGSPRACLPWEPELLRGQPRILESRTLEVQRGGLVSTTGTL